MDTEVVLTALTVVGTVIGFIWKKIIKPILGIIKQHDEVVVAINMIKDEVVTEDGDSLKNSIKSLKHTCENIEKAQKTLEQRARSSLHYSDQALFETDRDGQLVWTNEAFYNLTKKTTSDMLGYDWITLIREEERGQFLNEFSSCIQMGRKLEIDTMSSHNQSIGLVGYPFKCSETEHDGFLINIYLNGGKDERPET